MGLSKRNVGPEEEDEKMDEEGSVEVEKKEERRGRRNRISKGKRLERAERSDGGGGSSSALALRVASLGRRRGMFPPN